MKVLQVVPTDVYGAGADGLPLILQAGQKASLSITDDGRILMTVTAHDRETNFLLVHDTLRLNCMTFETP